MSRSAGADWATTPAPGLTFDDGFSSRYSNNALVPNHITENINNNKE
jgi:hypothetical protein